MFGTYRESVRTGVKCITVGRTYLSILITSCVLHDGSSLGLISLLPSSNPPMDVG